MSQEIYRIGRGELQSSIRLVADDESARHGKMLAATRFYFFAPLSTKSRARKLKPSQEVGESKNHLSRNTNFFPSLKTNRQQQSE